MGTGEAVAVLSEVAVNIVAAEDETRFHDLMQRHHYLGAAPGMGETVRYVAPPSGPMAGACDVLGAGAEMWGP